jgi:hypothetical protein
MRVTYDFEFLEDGRTIDPISIGMVAEDDREYYAVFRDFDQNRVKEHPWLSKHVWPQLPLDDSGPELGGPWLDMTHPDVKPVSQIRAEVLRFLMDTPSLSLWAWYAAYDHVALAQLWGPMAAMPIGIPQRTNDIAQEWERLGYPLLPEQPSGNHNALEDARFNIVRLLWLDQVAKKEKK